MEVNAFILENQGSQTGNWGSFGVDGEKFVFRYFPKPGIAEFFKRLLFLSKAGEFQKYWTAGAVVTAFAETGITLTCSHKHNTYEYHFRIDDGQATRDQIVGQIHQTFQALQIS